MEFFSVFLFVCNRLLKCILLTNEYFVIHKYLFPDLTDNTVTFGKNLSCDIRIAGEKIPKEVYVTCSKVHFEIRRKQIEVMGAPTTQIDIIDKSCNGTFINGSLLHKKKRVLRTNDVIGLPISKKRGVSYEGNTIFLCTCLVLQQSFSNPIFSFYVFSLCVHRLPRLCIQQYSTQSEE